MRDLCNRNHLGLTRLSRVRRKADLVMLDIGFDDLYLLERTTAHSGVAEAGFAWARVVGTFHSGKRSLESIQEMSFLWHSNLLRPAMRGLYSAC